MIASKTTKFSTVQLQLYTAVHVLLLYITTTAVPYVHAAYVGLQGYGTRVPVL